MITLTRIILSKIRLISLFLLLYASAALVSCRGNKSTSKDHFKISIDLLAHKSHTIQVFYVLKADDSYVEGLSMRKLVAPGENVQRLVFELPLGVKAKNIRIDLGEYGNENDSIRLENISFQYKTQVLDGSHGKYKSWFTFNPNVVPGKDSLTFHLKPVKNYFDPQLNGNRKLNALLVKLFPPNIYEK